eukprot:5867311-Pyramimonas_sp.AAC.1
MVPPPYWCTPSHALRGPIRSSTEGPSGAVGMAPPPPFWHTPRTVRPPHGSWPHRERGQRWDS